MLLTDHTLDTMKLVREVSDLAAIPPASRTDALTARARWSAMKAVELATEDGRAAFQKLLEAQSLIGFAADQFPRNPWPAYEPAVPGGPPRIAELLKTGIQGELTWDQKVATAAEVVTKPLGEAWDTHVVQPARAIGTTLKWTALGLGAAALVGVTIAVARAGSRNTPSTPPSLPPL